MNKYIGLIKEMYNNRVLLHNPIQIADSNMPTEILEILSISNGIEEVITFKDRKEAIGWILYSYEMIKSDTEFYKAEYGIDGFVFSDDGAGNVYVIKEDGAIYLFNAIDGKEEYYAETLSDFWHIKGGVNRDGAKYLEWDEEHFVIPEEYKLEENADLADALNVFWSAGGFDFFNVIDPEYYGSNWLEYMGMLYEKIISGQYKISDKQYSVPLTDEQKAGFTKRGVPEVFVTDLVM